jgi:hypothetical protein
MKRFVRTRAGALLVGSAAFAAACGSDSPIDPTPPQPGNSVITGNITQNRTLSADTVYQLRGIVQVQNGATLTIQPGTRITGSPISDAANRVSALIVMRGARLVAEGTRDRPIVFTSAATGGDADPRYPGDWGGLVIVGNATTNRQGRVTVEGPSPADTVSWNGGTDDNDSSGSLRYVRVEFAGAAAVLNSELNSFTFYAVGRGTRLEYLQALMGLDDHFEWFGGTVDGRYLVSYEAGDDHFDAAEGYRGRNKYLIGLQSFKTDLRPGATGVVSAEQSGFEVDGCGATGGTCPQGYNSTPYSMPVFANFTIVGPGPDVFNQAGSGWVRRGGQDGQLGANIRRGTGGVWVNGIFARWPERGISIFDQETNARLEADSIFVGNVLFAENRANYDDDGATSPVRYAQAGRFATANHRAHNGTAASLFANLFATGSAPTLQTLDWRPAAGSMAASGGLTTFPARVQARVQGWGPNGQFGTFAGTNYVGAADPNGERWWEGWTSYARR